MILETEEIGSSNPFTNRGHNISCIFNLKSGPVQDTGYVTFKNFLTRVSGWSRDNRCMIRFFVRKSGSAQVILEARYSPQSHRMNKLVGPIRCHCYRTLVHSKAPLETFWSFWSFRSTGYDIVNPQYDFMIPSIYNFLFQNHPT